MVSESIAACRLALRRIVPQQARMTKRSKPKMTRKESQALTREKLMESGRRCFARLGYERSSVNRIIEDAQSSKGAFYANFDSKESILLEILKEHHAHYIDELRVMIDQAASAEEMQASMEHWGAQRNQEPEWADLNIELIFYAKRNPLFREKYYQYFQQYEGAIAELIALRFQKLRREPPAPIGDLAAVLIAIADGLALQHSVEMQDRAEITGTMLNLVSRSWIAVGNPAPNDKSRA